MRIKLNNKKKIFAKWDLKVIQNATGGQSPSRARYKLCYWPWYPWYMMYANRQLEENKIRLLWSSSKKKVWINSLNVKMPSSDNTWSFWAKWKNGMYGGKLTSPRTHKRIMLWFSALETVKLVRVLTILKEICVRKLWQDIQIDLHGWNEHTKRFQSVFQCTSHYCSTSVYESFILVKLCRNFLMSDLVWYNW